MNEEDEAFNEIEQRAKQRMEAVKAAMRGEDDDIQEYKRPWVGLTDEEIWEAYMKAPLALDCSTDELYAISRTVEAKLKEKNHG